MTNKTQRTYEVRCPAPVDRPTPTRITTIRRKTINTSSWRIVAAIVVLTTLAAGLLFATGLKANAENAPSYDRGMCDRAFAASSGCHIQGP